MTERTVTFEEQNEKNLRILQLIRDDHGWALSRILRAEELEAELKKERGLKMDALLRAEKAERLMYHYQSLLGERGLL